MSDQPSHRGLGHSRKFIPEVKSLENRVLLSTAVPKKDIVWFPNPPRTGGIAFQTGFILNCLAGNPRRNTVEVTDDGIGDVRMSWNGSPIHSFTGVATTIIQAERARTDLFTIDLRHGDTVTAVAERAGSAFDESGPSTGSAAIELGPHRPIDSSSAEADGHDRADVQFVRAGLAVQSGSVLTVTVRRPGTNVVQIINVGAGNVEVAWNGGAAHSFAGVDTIVVDTHNGKRDQVTLQDAGPA
jgi:hypothetical protein